MNFKLKAAKALYEPLSVFHVIAEKTLKHVRLISTDDTSDKLILDFGEKLLIVIADQDDDSVDLSAVESNHYHYLDSVDQTHLSPWCNCVGRVFGWGWITINQQGYCDGILLSFEGIDPSVIINVMASSFRIGTIAITV